jgi:hypothetical protein
VTGHLSLPLEAWPAGDRAAWLAAISPCDDLLGTGGHGAHLRPETRKTYVYTWGQLLAVLDAAGDLDPAEPPEARLSLPRLQRLVDAMLARGVSGFSRRQALAQLRRAGRMLAPHAKFDHVTRPGGRALARVIPGRPRPFVVRDVEEAMARVRALHAEALPMRDGPARRQALRDAAFLGLLARRAPRVGSCVRMTLGHLRPGPDGTLVIALGPDDTKTRIRLDIGLDAEITALLRDYLTLARPGFPRAGESDALWLGMKGPMHREGLQRLVRRRTEAWFGEGNGPHLFRKWLRHSAGERDPELARDTEWVMGHGPETANASYTARLRTAATRRQAERLAQLRRVAMRGAKPASTPRPPRS